MSEDNNIVLNDENDGETLEDTTPLFPEQHETENVKTETEKTNSETEKSETENSETNLLKNENLSKVPEKFINAEGEIDYEALTKSYNHLSKKLGANDAVSDIKDYVFDEELEKMVSDLGYVQSDEKFNSFKEGALKSGLSKDQFNWVMNEYWGSIVNDPYSSKNIESTLKSEWADSYDDNIKNAKIAHDQFCDGIDDKYIVGNPGVIKVLANIGAQMHEDSGSLHTSGASSMTSDELAELQGREDYWTNPDVQSRVKSYFENNG